MQPPKLQVGDVIRIISPSSTPKISKKTKDRISEKFYSEFGCIVEYSKNSFQSGEYGSASIAQRIEDIHEAFSDKRVKAIFCWQGGFNCNEILDSIDWQIIKKNPKIFMGSSDITVLLNAIYVKTSLITYHGPNFFKFGMEINLEYTIEYIKKIFFESNPYLIYPSKKWSEDKWYIDQTHRLLQENKGYCVLQEGTAMGVVVGGNLCSINLLQGTQYMPSLKNVILFLEEDDFVKENTFGEFNRNLHSLLQLPEAKFIKGIAFGRFFSVTKMNKFKIKFILNSIEHTKNIPILTDLDFGHTDPAFTFPIGGFVELVVKKNTASIKILAV